MATNTELVQLQQTLYNSKNPTRRWLHRRRRDQIIDAIQRFSLKVKQKRALEVGPGSGIYLPILAERFEEVIASDVEEVYLKHASLLQNIHPNLNLVTDDITNSKLPEASFDLILCTEVIEHIADSVSAIAGMHRLLKPGGILVLSTPQRWSPLELTAKIAFLPGIINLVKLIYREPILETGHINLMTAKQVTHQLEGAGFHIHESFKSGMYLPLIAEFTGAFGLRLERWLEIKLTNSPLDWLLWTQYYIAEA
ncbi:class I SAM-dependent methyltransferase [Coleofasciculus sp. F4-SAH-05]|uniref:class I SAM-dependent methyltransferase n=1 Tax=Coleofasciculus sp. F4-SAH-05 TaxID=3069525 RepID=UPI0033046FAC